MTSHIRAGHLMEEISGQVGGAELYELRSLGTPVRFQAGALESVKSVETTGRALRVIHEGRLGFSTTTDLADYKTLIHNALQSAQFGGPATFDFPEREPVAPVACFDAEVEKMGAADLIELGEEISEADVHINPDYAYPAYGVPSEETNAAIRLAARTEAMITDPVYEGKSMQGMIDLVRKGFFPAGCKVLYAHLGGVPAINAYSYIYRNG